MTRVRVNIHGEIHEGPTVVAVVHRIYGSKALVWPSIDPNAPHYGQVVTRAQQNAYNVHAVIRWVDHLDDDGEVLP